MNDSTQSDAIVDMRSDTVTKPTPAMREAMKTCEVGDDVWGDDPTIIKLEKLAAQILGKEAGMFVPSGTMGNLLCCMTHCNERGAEMIVGDEAHIYYYEQGGSASIAGVQPRAVRTQPDGTLALEDIERAIRPIGDLHYPLTRLICLENTHNRMGGRVLTAEYTDAVGELAKKHNLKLHIDGARIFNAAVALGVPAARLVRAADSVCVCLSKGLASPVGSIVVASAAFIALARRFRKVLGGGMRQAGVLAACGLISLNEMVDRLREDHVNAQALARGLAAVHGVVINPADVQTNIVFFSLDPALARMDAFALRDVLQTHNILAAATAKHRLRFCTHYQVSQNDVVRTVEIVKKLLLSY